MRPHKWVFRLNWLDEPIFGILEIEVDMNDEIRNIIRSIRDEFSVESIYVFGSHGRGDANSESDIDILIVSNENPEDPFELAYAIRRHLHTQLDSALDVIVISKEQFDRRHVQPWTVEHAAYTEGIAI